MRRHAYQSQEFLKKLDREKWVFVKSGRRGVIGSWAISKTMLVGARNHTGLSNVSKQGDKPGGDLKMNSGQSVTIFTFCNI